MSSPPDASGDATNPPTLLSSLELFRFDAASETLMLLRGGESPPFDDRDDDGVDDMPMPQEGDAVVFKIGLVEDTLTPLRLLI